MIVFFMQQFQKANAEGMVELVYHRLTNPNKIINLDHVFSTPAHLRPGHSLFGGCVMHVRFLAASLVSTH